MSESNTAEDIEFPRQYESLDVVVDRLHRSLVAEREKSAELEKQRCDLARKLDVLERLDTPEQVTRFIDFVDRHPKVARAWREESPGRWIRRDLKFRLLREVTGKYGCAPEDLAQLRAVEDELLVVEGWILERQ